MKSAYNPGQNYVGKACRMHCLDHRSVFTWKQTFFGPNPTFPPPPPPSSPHAMLFVRKGLPTSRATLHRGGRGERANIAAIREKRNFVPHILARIVATDGHTDAVLAPWAWSHMDGGHSTVIGLSLDVAQVCSITGVSHAPKSLYVCDVYSLYLWGFQLSTGLETYSSPD